MDILFVEDSEESCVLFSKLLTSGGHRVVPAGSVAEALQLLNSLRFDALVSDIALPDGSGLELVAEARETALAAGDRVFAATSLSLHANFSRLTGQPGLVPPESTFSE